MYYLLLSKAVSDIFSVYLQVFDVLYKSVFQGALVTETCSACVSRSENERPASPASSGDLENPGSASHPKCRPCVCPSPATHVTLTRLEAGELCQTVSLPEQCPRDRYSGTTTASDTLWRPSGV